jgi:competence protein ComEA
MRTELPAERLQRRLGADGESDADGDGEPDTSLSRWLPDSTKSDGTAGWVAAVRADPGRAGVIALAVVGVIAVLVTVFTLVREKPPPVASAKLPPVEMVSSGRPTPSPRRSTPTDRWSSVWWASCTSRDLSRWRRVRGSPMRSPRRVAR